jgi:hypothetical protein
MNPMISIRKSFVLALGIGALTSAPQLQAQSFLMPGTPSRGVWMEATHTSFKVLEADLPTTVWYLAGRLPIGPRIGLVADLPFSHARVEILGASESSSVVGNPYLGVDFAASPRLELALGTRLPLTSADEESFADIFAVVADPERTEAFAEQMVPVIARATWRHHLSPAVGLRAHGGVTGFFPTADDAGDADAAADYGLLASYETGPARFAAGVSGRWLATSDEGSFSDNSLHHAGISTDLAVGRVRPGLSLRVPLDSDYRRVVSSSVTLYVQVPLR